MGPMTKVASLKMVRSITSAGQSTIAITIVGSVFLIISALPQAFSGLEGIWAASFDHIEDLYMLAYYASVSAISIYFLIGVTYEYARILNEEDDIEIQPINAVMISIFAFLILVPQLEIVDGVISLVTDADSAILSGIEIGTGTLARFGASSLFVTFIVSFYAVRIYAFCVQKHIVIKLPDVVPSGVANSFTSLIPVAFVAIVTMLIQGIFQLFGTNIFDIVSIPFGFVVNIVDTLPGMLVIIFLIHALWSVGVHGANIISSLLSAIQLSNMAENALGGHYLYAGEFLNSFIVAGGSGATLGLTILMLVFAKSEQLKAVGKAEIACAIFNINEPLLFGLPIVYNPSMIIPFILAPMAAGAATWIEFQLGLFPPITIYAPWCAPSPLCAFISTGGSVGAIIGSCINIVVATLVYLPFFKRYDAKLYAEEQAKLAEKNAEKEVEAA